MRSLFYDAGLQAKFDREGYVILDLFSAEEAESFLALYDKLEGARGTANTNNNSYELSFFEKDEDMKRKKFARVYEFMKPYVDAAVIRYKPIIINLFNKHHGTGEVPLHQNWTFVDETEYTSVSMWCPLQDVSRANGTLEIVPGTHKVICDYRGPSIPWVFDNLNELMKEKYMMPLDLRLGQVAVIDDSIIHFSGVNHTLKERKAVQVILKPEEAPTIHCFRRDKESDEISIIHVPDDYFFGFDMWEMPKGGENQRTIHYPIVKLTESQLLEKTSLNLMPI